MENEIVLILLGFVAGAVCFSCVFILCTLLDKEKSKKECEGQKELPTKQLNMPDELKTRDERIDRLIKEGWLTIVVLRTILESLPKGSQEKYAEKIMHQLSLSVGGNFDDMEELIQLSDYHLIRKYIKK